MRTLFLVGRDPEHPAAGGGDLQAWQWAQWCTGRGHEVTYVCQSHPDLPARARTGGIAVRRLGTGPGLAARALRYYRANSRAIDLVYEDPIGAGRTPYLSPLYAKVPVIAVWHQVSRGLLMSMHSRVVAEALSTVEMLLAHAYRSSFVWVPSEERAAEVISELRLPEHRVVVLPPTIGSFPEPLLSAGKRERNLLLFIGNIRPYKMIEHAIEVLGRLSGLSPPARLIIAGRAYDRDYETRLHLLVERLGLGQRVSFQLNVSEEEKSRLIAQASVLVLPSLLEGFGIVAIEAGAHGTPVVASSGVPEDAVTDGANGLRYPYHDLGAFTAAVARTLSDPQLYGSLARGGIDHARRHTVASVGPRFDEMIARAKAEQGG